MDKKPKSSSKTREVTAKKPMVTPPVMDKKKPAGKKMKKLQTSPDMGR